MSSQSAMPLVTVDIGNSRIKLGEFAHASALPLPHPERAAALPLDWTSRQLENALAHDAVSCRWAIASVNRPATAKLADWLSARKVPHVHLLKYTDLDLTVDLPRPDLVGIDRLANAVAANRLRTAGRAAIVIDLGSAITVDLLNTSGAFCGGAILPGIAMSARALHEFTDLLPLVESEEPPPALGKSTLEAIRSGLYWGATGAVRELITRLTDGTRAADVFLTGGAAPNIVPLLAESSALAPKFVPHLTLAGIALATPHDASDETPS